MVSGGFCVYGNPLPRVFLSAVMPAAEPAQLVQGERNQVHTDCRTAAQLARKRTLGEGEAQAGMVETLRAASPAAMAATTNA